MRHADILIDPPSGSDSSTSGEIRSILEEAGFTDHPSGLGEIAVLDGTHLSPTDSTVTDSGDPRNTLWGEMAYQLGGQSGYEIVGEAARTGIAPGQAQLDALFDHVGPSVVLIDELVAYWRNAVNSDSVYTFLQALTQSVSARRDVALVVTLPESQEEAGGERGREALEILERLFGRIEAVWEPLAVSEAFEVVSRRLFGEIRDPAERDRTCDAFSRLYSSARRNYPQAAGEPAYLVRLKACYPVHPEIYDRLYSDWSSLAQFQRTRGVLRMMASCVSYLYRNDDANPLIMPANLPLRDQSLIAEFNRLLPGNWGPVISEADSDGSRADRIDETARFAQVGGAAKRVARTVFLGSAPGGALRGIDERQIRLGAVQPNDRAASYNEALQEVSKELHYLYNSNDCYYFHAEENLNKVAADRATQLSDAEADRYITEMLNADVRRNNRDVVVFANGEAVIPDNSQGVRLAILPPDKAINSRAAETNDAETEAKRALLTNSNEGNRIHRNTVLFLATKRDEARALRQAVKNFLNQSQSGMYIWAVAGIGPGGAPDADVRRNNRDVVVFANGEAVIPDNSQGVRLAILPPDKAINSRAAETNDAETEAKRALLTNSNEGNRIHRNTVLFLATKRDEARALRQAVKNFLAWNSISNVRGGDDRRITGLTGERANQANVGLRNAASAVNAALVAAYRWGLAPKQPDPQDATRIQFTELRTNVADHGEIVNAAFNRFIEEEALVEKIAPAHLARILQERVWGTPAYGDHVDINALWEMLTSYIYLPRLRNRSVLQLCIEEGVVAGTFGYAREYNPETGEYRGLRYEGPLHDPALGMVINENSGGLLVAPSRAAEEKRKELERQQQDNEDERETGGTGTYTVCPPPGGTTETEGHSSTTTRTPRPRRVRASKTARGDLSLDDFSNLRNDIIRVLRDSGGEVTVTITIEASKDDGFDEGVIRPVRDNSGQLGLDFDSFDLE